MKFLEVQSKNFKFKFWQYIWLKVLMFGDETHLQFVQFDRLRFSKFLNLSFQNSKYKFKFDVVKFLFWRYVLLPFVNCWVGNFVFVCVCIEKSGQKKSAMTFCGSPVWEGSFGRVNTDKNCKKVCWNRFALKKADKKVSYDFLWVAGFGGVIWQRLWGEIWFSQISVLLWRTFCCYLFVKLFGWVVGKLIK